MATVLILLVAETADASWLSEITGIDVNIPAGTISFSTPKPSAIPDMLKNLPTDLLEFLNPYSRALAFAIREAQAQALHGAQPIPPNIRAVLASFFPAYILDKARWNVYDASRVTLDSLILGTDCSDAHLWFNIDCKMGAITFDNVIVFRGSAQGLSNYVSWAHELVHVSQYDSMGVDGFAYVYASVVGAAALENQAYNWQYTVQNAVPVGMHPQPPTQMYWTMASGPRTPLTAGDFARASSRFLADSNRALTNRIWGNGEACRLLQSPATDTGTSIPEGAVHFNRGKELEANRDWSGAIAEYRKATQYDRTNALAFDHLGELLVKTGHPADSVYQFKKAVCLDSSQSSFREHLVSAFQATGDFASAVRQYQMDAFQNPTDPSVRKNLAIAFRGLGDTDDAAIQDWAAAQLLPPDGGPLYAALRARLNEDWRQSWNQTNPVSGVASRTRVNLRRLDSCVLSWNESSETTNIAVPTLKSFTYTVNLGQVRPEDISLIGGDKVSFNNTGRTAVTSSLIVRVHYSYQRPGRPTKPLFAWLSAGSSDAARDLLTPIRTIVNSCRSH